MSVEITLTISGDKELVARLSKLDSSLNDLSAAFKQAGTALVKFYSTVPFASRGDIYGTPWPALTEAYAKRKAKKWGGGRPILIARGDLAKGFVFISSKDLLKIYNDTGDLFRWHQLGEGHNPQRAMMLFDQLRQKVVTDALEAEVKKKVEDG